MQYRCQVTANVELEYAIAHSGVDSTFRDDIHFDVEKVLEIEHETHMIEQAAPFLKSGPPE